MTEVFRRIERRLSAWGHAHHGELVDGDGGHASAVVQEWQRKKTLAPE